ncbi:hypothetical protein RND71_032032 [Anisodus tanguticus]|uniref:Uncharacterized protein n=1 Tax=Anisodus tanguticus TaxID=243964 RepID=A0AAE1REM6_9SOLA|nr:hypothetical protein RND71_032032 [Anisodus tanguticus]
MERRMKLYDSFFVDVHLHHIIFNQPPPEKPMGSALQIPSNPSFRDTTSALSPLILGYQGTLGIGIQKCAPLFSSAPPGSPGCWLTKHFPAAPAARLAGERCYPDFSLSGPSHCNSHKLWQLQLTTTGAHPARPDWAQRSVSIQIMLEGLSLLPDLERYYKSSIPNSIAAAIWFTGTTKKSHTYLTIIDGLIILDHEDPVMLLVSIPIIILMINLLLLYHKNLESVSW